MPTKIITKNSETAAAVPSNTLLVGELAVNPVDGTLFVGKTVGAGTGVEPLIGSTVDVVGASAAFTGGLTSTGAGTDSFRAGTSAGATTQGNSSIALGQLAGETNQGNNGIIISSKGSAVDDDTTGHIHIESSTGSLDYTTAAGWTATDSSSTFALSSLALAANLPLVVWSGTGVPTTIGIEIGSTAGTVAAGDDGRFDTVDISDLPAATALTGLELLSGLQDLDTVSMTTDRISGTPMTTKLGVGLKLLRGYSDFSNTPNPFTTTTNNALWGNDPYTVLVSGANADVNQGKSLFVAGLLFVPHAKATTGISPTGHSAIVSTQNGWPMIAGLVSSYDSQFTVNLSNSGTVNQSFIVRSGLLDSNFLTTPTQGMYFEYNGNGSDPNWKGCVRITDGASNTAVQEQDTGIPAVVNTSYVLRVFYNAPQLQTEFFIDGVLVQTIPDSTVGASRPAVALLSMQCRIQSTSGTGYKTMSVSRHKYEIEAAVPAHY